MKNKEVKSEITFLEASKILGKSERTLSRYIKKGLINPEKVKSNRGTIQYRFTQAQLDNFKIPGRQDTTQDIRQATRQDSDVINLLKETTQVLVDQLKIKDEQIKSMSKKIDQLIERSRESNILIKGMANKFLLIEGKNKEENKEDIKQDIRQDIRQDRGQKIKGFIDYIKGKFFK
jgi:DNA-binding transcriptional MerR regulator